MQLLKGHRRVVQSLAFSPDGKWLASGAGDRTIRLWNAVSGDLVHTWEPHGVMGNKVAFSPNSRWLAAVDFHRIRIYDVRTRSEVDVLSNIDPSGSVYGLAFSPDGKRFLAAGVGGEWNCWRIWDTARWKESKRDRSKDLGYVFNVAASPRQSQMAAITADAVLIGSFKSRASPTIIPIQQRSGYFYVLQFSPDGKLLVYGNNVSLTVRDLKAKRTVAELLQDKKHFQDGAFTPDGRVFATVSNEENVKYWDTSSWKVKNSFAWDIGKLKCIAFAPDGMRGAAGGDKGKIVVWDVDN